MKWHSRVHVRFLLGSIVIEVFLAIILLVLIYWANQPILHPSDPLAPRYFLSHYLRPYGWVLTILFAALSVIFQILIIKLTLRFVNASPPRRLYLVAVLFVTGIIVGSVWTQLLGDFAFSHFLVFSVGFLAPGLWPTYLIVRRWETQHQQTLIVHGLTFKTVNE